MSGSAEAIVAVAMFVAVVAYGSWEWAAEGRQTRARAAARAVAVDPVDEHFAGQAVFLELPPQPVAANWMDVAPARPSALDIEWAGVLALLDRAEREAEAQRARAAVPRQCARPGYTPGSAR